MRVLHLISGGDSGGAKTHIITLLKELHKEVELELVCLSRGALYEEAVKENIEVVLLEQKTRLDLRVVKKLANKINNENYDILHCHGARSNFISLFLRSSIKVPIITTVHSDYRLDFKNSWYKNLVFTYLNKKGLQKMDFYLSVSSKLRDILAEQGFDATRIFPIYNGLPLSGETRRYNEPMEAIVFGCATRLVPIKGTDVLLKACNECVQKGYNVQLKVAGTGEETYTQELKDYIEANGLMNHVVLLGFVKDMDSFYKSIDVNILPSYTEGFPYSLLESGARGIATIASKAGGIVEMITDGDNGRLFKVGDHSELAKIMMDMMDNKQKLAPIGQAFRDRVELQFSDTAMVKEHISIYKNVIKLHR